MKLVVLVVLGTLATLLLGLAHGFGKQSIFSSKLRRTHASQRVWRLNGRKIDAEAEAMGTSGSKKGKKKVKSAGKKGGGAVSVKTEDKGMRPEPKKASGPIPVIAAATPVPVQTEVEQTGEPKGEGTIQQGDVPPVMTTPPPPVEEAPGSTIKSTNDGSQDIVKKSIDVDEPPELWTQQSQEEEEENFELIDSTDVLKSAPTAYGKAEDGAPTAEVLFFGEPRRPPPIQALQDTRYHGPLLSWARHANFVAVNEKERAELVFLDRNSVGDDSYRLDKSSISYQSIFDGFVAVMDNVEEAKKFVLANVVEVPPKLFLRALTAEKLSAQSKGDVERMKYLKQVRDAYILAHDQMYFALNVELQKAETRVMTYVGRMEMFEGVENWDSVELTAFFTTLLAARLTWDGRCKDVLQRIDTKVRDTVGYMEEGIRSDLMTREFKRPGQSAEIYRNASIAIQARNPEQYESMRPEVKVVQETYFLVAEMRYDEAKAYILNDFLPKNNLELETFKQGLRYYEAALAAMHGIDYLELRLVVNKLHEILLDPAERARLDKWYADFRESPQAQFDTYETDDVPMMLKSQQRMRDTGSAFDDFVVQVLKGQTKYANALSGARPKGNDKGNWLKKDEDWNVAQPASIEERIESFKAAYVKQTESRKLEESIKLFKDK